MKFNRSSTCSANTIPQLRLQAVEDHNNQLLYDRIVHHYFEGVTKANIKPNGKSTGLSGGFFFDLNVCFDGDYDYAHIDKVNFQIGQILDANPHKDRKSRILNVGNNDRPIRFYRNGTSDDLSLNFTGPWFIEPSKESKPFIEVRAMYDGPLKPIDSSSFLVDGGKDIDDALIRETLRAWTNDGHYYTEKKTVPRMTIAYHFRANPGGMLVAKYNHFKNE